MSLSEGHRSSAAGAPTSRDEDVAMASSTTTSPAGQLQRASAMPSKPLIEQQDPNIDYDEVSFNKDKEATFNANASVNSSSSKRTKKDQTKGNHTIFIHKLYNMLEDTTIRHLIWWSDTHDSFFIIPSEEFCKVLLSYFKHSNVASFIRQLNMYGFHKVNDSNSSDKDKKEKARLTKEESIISATIWEFSHSSRMFRKGDFDNLKNIRRRSSKNPNANSKDKQTNSDDNLKSLIESKRIKEQDEYEGNNTDSNPASLRKNSANSANGYNDTHPGSRESHYYGAALGASRAEEISMLNMKLSELSYNLAAMRHEHARLQLQYESAMDELKRTNMDMVHLLDLVLRVASQSKESPVETDNQSHLRHPLLSQHSSHHLSNAKQNEQRSQNAIINLEHELSSFRASIIQRTSMKELMYDLPTPLMQPAQQPSHLLLHPSLQRARFSPQDLSLHAKSQKPHTYAQEQDSKNHCISQPSFRENSITGKLTSNSARSESPFSNGPEASQQNGENYPFKYVVSNPQSQPPTPLYGPKPNSSSTQYGPSQTKFPEQNNPFLQDVTFSSNGTNRSRTMSILCDPLAPEPVFSTQGAQSPSTTDSKHTANVFSPDLSQAHSRQSGYFSSISSARTSEGGIPFNYHVNGTHLSSGAYPPFHDTSGPSNVLNDKLNEEMLRKRHSSNDVLFDRSRNNDSINSQLTLAFVNAPKSVPDIYNLVPGGAKHFSSGRLPSTILQTSERSASIAPTLPSLSHSKQAPTSHPDPSQNGANSGHPSPGILGPTSSTGPPLPSHLMAYIPRTLVSRTNSPKVTHSSSSSAVYSLLNHDEKDYQRKSISGGPGENREPVGSIKSSFNANDREYKRIKLDPNQENVTSNETK